jgi:hypothetical protein
VNKKIQEKLCESLDQLITFVREAAREDMVPQLQADEIINELLDARTATTAQAAREPEPVRA